MKAVEEITHAHLFCGLGGGAAGFNRGHARHGRGYDTEKRGRGFRAVGIRSASGVECTRFS